MDTSSTAELTPEPAGGKMFTQVWDNRRHKLPHRHTNECLYASGKFDRLFYIGLCFFTKAFKE
jgi:hypothetical protein